MSSKPKDPVVRNLWDQRRKLMDRVAQYTNAINALQELCPHIDEVDVSHHGSPEMVCFDCGKGLLP